MGRFNRPSRPRRRSALLHPEMETVPGRSARIRWVMSALSLLLIAVPILFFNQQHSGDRLKIRRELRKF